MSAFAWASKPNYKTLFSVSPESKLSSIALQALYPEDMPEDESEGAEIEGAQDFENDFEEGAEEEPEDNGEESWSAFILFWMLSPLIVLDLISVCGWLDNILRVSWMS